MRYPYTRLGPSVPRRPYLKIVLRNGSATTTRIIRRENIAPPEWITKLISLAVSARLGAKLEGIGLSLCWPITLPTFRDCALLL